MAIKRIVQGAGVVTDPSALSAEEAAPGAMRQADNVIMHRPGTIQPRPGFGDTTGIASRTTGFRPIALMPYETAEEIIVQSTTGATWRLEFLDADTTITTGTDAVEPPEANTRGVADFFEARGSLYHTSLAGLRKLTKETTTLHTAAGMWQRYQRPSVSFIDATATNERVAIDSSSADSTVGYRYVVLREDERGYEVRGPASSRIVLTALNATHANGVYVNFSNLFLPAEALAGDIIEFYRTPNTAGGSDPGEDFYFAASHTVTSAEITLGFISANITDDVVDAALGAALYSSPSQQGALSAKLSPPLANHLAWWNQVAWAANMTNRTSYTLSVTKVTTDDSTPELEGIGLTYLDTMRGDFTSGSPTISNVTFSSGLGASSIVAGMWLGESSGLVIPPTPPTKVVSITGAGPYTITMDANADSTSGSQAFYGGDVVTVDGQDFLARDDTGGSDAGSQFSVNQSGSDTLAERVYETARNLAWAISRHAASLYSFGGSAEVVALKDEVASGGDGELLLVRQRPAISGTFTISTTRPTAFSQDLTSEVTTPAATFTDRLQWSAPDEPEAWPPANFTRVGEQDYKILSLVPLDDALIIFKEDGIYRLSGSPPGNWIVDRIDTTKRLVAPLATCVLDGVCYAWTDRGLVAVTEGGVSPAPISRPIAHELREAQRVFPFDTKGHKRGVWLQAHPRLGLVILNYCDGISDETADRGQWVWHKSTGAWSRWTRTEDRCSSYDKFEDRMVVAVGTSGWDAFYERSDEDSDSSYRDRVSSTITPNEWTTTTVVDITKTDVDWDPTVCDVLEYQGDTTTYHRVTDVADGGSSWIITVTPAVAATACFDFLVDEFGDFLVDESGDFLVSESESCAVVLHEGFAVTLLWQAEHLPGMGGFWTEIHAQLLDGSSGLLDTWLLELGAQGHGMAAPEDADIAVSSDVALSRPYRVGIPRNAMRSVQLYPYAKVCTAGVLWRLSELHLHATPTSRRVAK